MKKELAMGIKQPVLFLDDWPLPPMGSEGDQFEKPGMSDVKRWRLQMLLAVNPWGIPSLALADAFKKMFRRELDIQDMGFEHLSDMVSQLADVFTVQEPDDVTAIMFPDYPHDKILHDARVGQVFDDEPTGGDALNQSDPDMLNTYAWINRDDNFPNDVVLAGEQYSEIILPMTPANIPGTRGVHQAVLVGAASPDHFYLNIKNTSHERVAKLSAEISLYFKECGLPVEMYNVPDEFIYKGFPCLVFVEQEKCWERCEIIGRSPRGNKILVETVDYGGTHTVNQICLFLMPKKFFDFPKQGVLVSLIGIKPPKGAEKWSVNVNTRVRSFSNPYYYLDCLLLEPERESMSEERSVCDTVSLRSIELDMNNSDSTQPKKRKRLQRRRPQFNVIVCDRNDDEMDIYLDEVLVLETYAIPDVTQSANVEALKQQLNLAFSSIPRPKNSLV